jgi:hypothetical protein
MIELEIYIDENSKPQLVEADRTFLHDFYSENRQKWIKMKLTGADETRTYQMNKRYWAMLGYFVPDHFNSTDEAHEHFTEKYLSKLDIFDINEDSFDEILSNIKKYARKIKSIKTNSNIEIQWIRSTSTISKKEFTELMGHVEREGSELGIEFGQ